MSQYTLVLVSHALACKNCLPLSDRESILTNIFFLSDPEMDAWGVWWRGQEKYVEQVEALSVLAN